jgi:hypothetical protein
MIESILFSSRDVPVNPLARRQEGEKKNHYANADTAGSESRLVIAGIIENYFACP